MPRKKKPQWLVRLFCEEAEPREEVVFANNELEAFTNFGKRIGHTRAYWNDFGKRLWGEDKGTIMTHRVEIYKLVTVHGRTL